MTRDRKTALMEDFGGKCPKCGEATEEVHVCPECLATGCVERCNSGGNNCLCGECEEKAE